MVHLCLIQTVPLFRPFKSSGAYARNCLDDGSNVFDRLALFEPLLRSRKAAINAIVKIADHLHGYFAAIFERPAGALIAVTLLEGHLQDRLVGATVFLVEIGFFVYPKIFHVLIADAVFWQALPEITRYKAEDLFFHVDGETLGERNVDPRADEKVDQPARFR